MKAFLFPVLLLVLALLAGCAISGGISTNYPLLTPPVAAAVPTGLHVSSSGKVLRAFAPASWRGVVDGQNPALDVGRFQSSFFSGSGPTDLWSILSSVDDQINGINIDTRSRNAACLSQTPVPVTVTMAGQSMTLELQCYKTVSVPNPVSADPALVEWGQGSDGRFYLYSAIGQVRQAAIATPLTTSSGNATSAATKYSVVGWASVGVLNGIATGGVSCQTGGWDDCSYAVMQFRADPSQPVFEMSVAGVNVGGFAGAQYVSDGTNIFGEGDDGLESGSGLPATVCVQASSITTAVTSGCTVSSANFQLTPLGITAVASNVSVTSQTGYPASYYPGGAADNVTLSGLSSDDVHFGPSEPNAGVGAFQ